MCFCSVKRFNSLVFNYWFNWKHPPLIFGCIDSNYFVIIKEYISMNTCKYQSSNYFMREVLVVKKPVHWFVLQINRLVSVIIGTSVMNDSRRSSSTYTNILTCCKAEFAFFVLAFFSIWLSFTNIHDSQDSRWRGKLSPSIFSTTSTHFEDT